jgi:Na+/proline symporter
MAKPRMSSSAASSPLRWRMRLRGGAAAVDVGIGSDNPFGYAGGSGVNAQAMLATCRYLWNAGIFLFSVAFVVERRAAQGRLGFLRSPVIYTLSLSIYCTAWTFYGAVGYAARSGIEYLTIYLGPTLVFVGWWLVLRKLVRIGRQQRVTSIADLISSRFGKSNILGVVVTLIAVVATTPYIALQLQSMTLSFSVFAQDTPEAWLLPGHEDIALWVAAGLALFTILFGTRNLDAKEQHHGIVTAIAVEAVVKLVALLAVGIFVVWGLAGGIGAVIDKIAAVEADRGAASMAARLATRAGAPG